jgi:cysteine-rich repeat protein
VFNLTCPVCGDGLLEIPEECDDAGESAACDANCTFAECGDGTWNVSAGEVCDDGNTAGGDDCSADCSVVATGVPGEASPDRDMRASRAGASIDVTFEPACAATDHAAYWSLGPISGAVLWVGSSCGLGTTGTASFDPGVVLLPGEWLYFVTVGYDGEDEGNYGGRPEGVGIGACDRPIGSSTCE